MISMAVKRGWSGRAFEDFEVGDVYDHPLGRTILAADNAWFTLLTMNTNPIHFDTVYAAGTEFGKPLVNSCLTLAVVTGQSVTDLSQNALANLEWGEIKMPHPVFEGDTIYSRSEVLGTRESKTRPHVGIVRVKTTGFNQERVVVLEFTGSFMVYKRGHIPRRSNRKMTRMSMISNLEPSQVAQSGLFGWSHQGTPAARKGLWAAALGSMLDGFDVMLYALVLGALLQEFSISTRTAGMLGSLTLAASGLGGGALRGDCRPDGTAARHDWQHSDLFNFHRLVRLGATVTQLAMFRFVLGLGMGGEWTSGAALVSETWPDEHRGKAVAWMQSAWAIGTRSRHCRGSRVATIRVARSFSDRPPASAVDALNPATRRGIRALACFAAGAGSSPSFCARRILRTICLDDHAPDVPESHDGFCLLGTESLGTRLSFPSSHERRPGSKHVNDDIARGDNAGGNVSWLRIIRIRERRVWPT